MNQKHSQPADIEKTSMAIIEAELSENGILLRQETAAVVRRVIHTTADFEYAETLCFSEAAVKKMAEALQKGAVIVTDTNMAKAGVDFLRRKGFSAAADTASMQSADHCAALPHKTVAVKAGLGWIGKNSLLVTEAFGSAFRMTVLLTNAPLPANHAILESNCRDCRACVDACPAKALMGNHWKIGISREELIDIFSCNALFERQMADTVDTCTKCLDVCPYTYRYFKQDTEEY